MDYKRAAVLGLFVYLIATLYLWHHPALVPAAVNQPMTAEAAAAELSHVSAQAPVSLITEPDDGMAPVLQAIHGATTSIELVVYELEDASVGEALVEAQSRGVAVRVLLDNVNTFGNHPNQAAFDFLQAHNIPVEWSPQYFALTHQKTLITDDAQVLIMTINLTPQYYDSSRDFAIADLDPADVSAIEAAFSADWSGERAMASNGNDLVWSPGSAPTLLAMIQSASTSLDVYNEEMADPRVISALESAAQRGVRVRVDMSYDTNWKSAFQSLSAAGVSVRTYASSAAFYIHAKVIIADHAEAFVGSQNFSTPSLDDNRELGILLTRPSVLSSLEETFEKDWAGSRVFVAAQP